MGTGSADHADRTGFDTVITTVAQLPSSRHRFSSWLAGSGVDDDVVSDLEVVFSELVTNAIGAAVGTPAGVLAEAWREGDEVVLEVTNADGGAALDPQRWDMDDQLRAGGRGLVIVRAFTDAVEVDRTDEGAIVVRCRRSVRPPGR